MYSITDKVSDTSPRAKLHALRQHTKRSSPSITRGGWGGRIKLPFSLSIFFGILTVGIGLIFIPIIINECAQVWEELDNNMNNFRAMQDKIWKDIVSLSDDESKRFRRQYSYSPIFPEVAITNVQQQESAYNRQGNAGNLRELSPPGFAIPVDPDYDDYSDEDSDGSLLAYTGSFQPFRSSSPGLPSSNQPASLSQPAPGIFSPGIDPQPPGGGYAYERQRSARAENFKLGLGRSEESVSVPGGPQGVPTFSVLSEQSARRPPGVLPQGGQNLRNGNARLSPQILPTRSTGGNRVPSGVVRNSPGIIPVRTPPGILPLNVGSRYPPTRSPPSIRTAKRFPPGILPRSRDRFSLKVPGGRPRPSPSLSRPASLRPGSFLPRATAIIGQGRGEAPPQLSSPSGLDLFPSRSQQPDSSAGNRNTHLTASNYEYDQYSGSDRNVQLKASNSASKERETLSLEEKFKASLNPPSATQGRLKGPGYLPQRPSGRIPPAPPPSFRAPPSLFLPGGPSIDAEDINNRGRPGGPGSRSPAYSEQPGRKGPGNPSIPGGPSSDFGSPGYGLKPPAGRIPPAPPPGFRGRPSAFLPGGPSIDAENNNGDRPGRPGNRSPGNSQQPGLEGPGTPSIPGGPSSDFGSPGYGLKPPAGRIPPAPPPGFLYPPGSVNPPGAPSINVRGRPGGKIPGVPSENVPGVPGGDLFPPNPKFKIPGSPSNEEVPLYPGGPNTEIHPIPSRRGPDGVKLPGPPVIVGVDGIPAYHEIPFGGLDHTDPPTRPRQRIPSSPGSVSSGNQRPGSPGGRGSPGGDRPGIRTGRPSGPGIPTIPNQRLPPQPTRRAPQPKCQCNRNFQQACPAGPPGPKGEAGTPGSRGADGSNGKRGNHAEHVTANTQKVCITCPQGAGGYKGKTGSPGSEGIPGYHGLSGNRGKDGAPGPKGPKGLQGSEGPTGRNGFPGREAPVAYRIKGLQGAKGPDGERGDSGPRGRRGSPGPVGPSGRSGVRGFQGNSGLNGVAGPRGSFGRKGIMEYCACPPRRPLILGIIRDRLPNFT